MYVGPFGREDRSEWDRAAGCPGSPSSQVNAQPREQASGRALGKNMTTSRRAERRLNRFEILDVLGEGHHATVYRAFDPFLERQVALKLPRPGAAPTARVLDRFLSEARRWPAFVILGSCRSTRPAAMESAITLRWP